MVMAQPWDADIDISIEKARRLSSELHTGELMMTLGTVRGFVR
jgi:hypothetical protein